MKAFGNLCFVIIQTISGAFVFMRGWNWLVVPIGVNAISFWQATGLIAFMGCFVVTPIIAATTLLATASGVDAKKVQFAGFLLHVFLFVGLWATFGFMAFAHFMMNLPR